jgi:hypothetical protein
MLRMLYVTWEYVYNYVNATAIFIDQIILSTGIFMWFSLKQSQMSSIFSSDQLNVKISRKFCKVSNWLGDIT